MRPHDLAAGDITKELVEDSQKIAPLRPGSSLVMPRGLNASLPEEYLVRNVSWDSADTVGLGEPGSSSLRCLTDDMATFYLHQILYRMCADLSRKISLPLDSRLSAEPADCS